MLTKVAIIAPGAMGSAVGRRLSEHGARVLTSLTGRSIATIRRAEATRMIGADDDAIAQAEVILSILPPKEALALAERFAAPLACASHKPIFADCNAINVETVRRIAAVITPTGAACVDGGISVRRQGKAAAPTSIFLGKPRRLWQGSRTLASMSAS
jgi:L-threonate 2-dehydrogenase